MQITLNQDEIETAITNYVRSELNIGDDRDITLDLRAGRGENGYSATVDIAPSKAKKPKVTRSAPATVVEVAAEPVVEEAAEESAEVVEEAAEAVDGETDETDDKPSIFKFGA